MAESLSIKVTIANRVYPLKVDAAEEAQVREASQMISNKVKQYEESFAVKDKQDLLAMTALEFATATLKNKSKADNVGSDLFQRLTELNNWVEKEVKV